MKSLIIAVSVLVYAVESLPNGAPQQACDSLTPAPQAHGALAQVTPSPYSIDLSPFADDSGHYSYQPGETYILTLSGNSSDHFRGFLVQARVQADNSTRIGVFGVTDSLNSRLSSCQIPTDGITHSNRNDKVLVSFQWTAPLQGSGPIRFAFAVVQVRTNYWANQRTEVILERSDAVRPVTLSPVTTSVPVISTPGGRPSPFFASFGSSFGDLLVPVGDDNFVGPIFLNQSFIFFGRNENEAYIGTNGVISFRRGFSLCCGTREFPRGPPPLISPYWHDFSTVNGGKIFYRQSRDPMLLTSFQSFVAKIYSGPFNPNSIFVVTWDRVAPLSNFVLDLSNTFQVWLGSDEMASFALFLYGDIQWGENAQIGFNAGDNNRSFSIPESLTADTLNIELRSNINETSVFLFRVDNLLMDILCPIGTYRPALQEDCLSCPRNTNTSVENGTICPCLPGYFRTTFEGPESDCTRPPSSCRNIRAISVDEKSVNVSWERPTISGRDDFYYIVEYSDGDSTGSNPVVSLDGVVQYPLSGLTPATDYIITVTVENGVSDRDPQNDYLRRCELRLTTMEGKPSPPIDFQSLCNVIVWGEPFNPSGDITGYEAQFYIHDTQVAVVREIARDRTVYIVGEEDKLGGNVNTFVRVRARTRIGPSEWSGGRSLGCDDDVVTSPPQTCPPCDCPTCPPVPVTEPPLTTAEPTPNIYFELGGQTFGNNSIVSLTQVGEGKDALLCKTDLISCCATVPNRFGEFYYPNGLMVPINNSGQGFYRNRGDQEIRLNRRQGITSPSGKFRCEIPTASGEIQNIFITLI